MPAIFVILAGALQLLYEARVPSFGCNSSAEVHALERVRADTAAFRDLLGTQIVYGQCIAIARGAVVEGTIEAADSAVLRVDARLSPPGWMAPLGDFAPVQP